mgnify:CR=1 FL=1
MCLAKCREEDYIQFLIASPRTGTCSEAEWCSPDSKTNPAHDAFNRLLEKQSTSTEPLWQEAKQLIRNDRGLLILDDSTLDKPYSRKMDLVSFHWSGKHHHSVKGINLLTTLWSDGVRLIPCDYRLYDKKKDGKNKNIHFRAMLEKMKQRGVHPEYVCFDSWYGASLDNLKQVNQLGWFFLTQIKSNRKVNPDNTGNISVSTLGALPEEGLVVHLRGFGFVRLFRIVYPDGGTEYWITNDLKMNSAKRAVLQDKAWGIEVYHRGLKQFCNIERAQVRKEVKIRAHIQFSVRAFLRLGVSRLNKNLSWFELTTALIRDAVKGYLASPTYLLPQTA